MVTKPGRLHRKLSPNGESIFRLTVGDNVYDDSQINSFTSRRGEASAETAISPSTLEFKMPGAPNFQRDSRVILRLTPEAAARFAAGTGITAAMVQDRFRGRKATTTVDDVAWKVGANKQKFYSTITASSWTSVLRKRRSRFTATAGDSQFKPLLDVFTHPNVNVEQPVTYSGAEATYSDTVAVTESDLSFDDITAKFGTDLGVLFQHKRDGSVNFMSPRYRFYLLGSRAGFRWPVLRSQGISPAQWAQPVESASEQFVLTRRTSTGTIYKQTWPLPGGAAPVMLETTDVDLSQVVPRTLNYEYVMNALNNRTNGRRMAMNSLTVDMIMLLSSKREVDRRIAMQVLELEAGDPIYFLGDWPQAIRGSYFASQITESVDSESWSITIDLSHPRDVLGLTDENIPQPKPKTWDQFVTTWDNTPGKWNDY